MNGASIRKAFLIVGVATAWALVVALNVFFFTRIVKWPLDLTLLILLPIVVIWAPGTYFVAVAGNERYQRGQGLGLSSQVMALSAVLGVLTGALSAGTIWLYLALTSGFYFGAAVVAALLGLCVWGAVHLFRQIVEGIHNAPND